MIALAPLLVSTLLPSVPRAALGKIDFPVSCSAPAQRAFSRGVSAMHSFWYAEATTQFKAAETADPHCSMAFWGEALSNLQLLWINDDVEAARAAFAKMPGEPPTPREKAWVAALRPLLTNEDPWPRRAAFAQAMERLHRDFPDDDEGKVFLALAILVASPDLDLAHEARAASLAFEVLGKNPDHPGALHYAIHALDTPDLAPLGLAAARRYAQTAPEAFHARHMPAHIFARLGMWLEALASCQSAWDVSSAWVATNKKLSVGDRDHHSLQWIIAIDVELGRLREAGAALALFAADARAADSSGLRGWYAATLVDYLRGTNQWSRLDALTLPDTAADTAAATAGPACHGPAQPMLDFVQLTKLNARRWAAVSDYEPKEVERLTALMVTLRAHRAGERAKQLGPAIFAREQKENTLADAALLATARGDDLAAAARWREMAALEAQDPPPEGADDLGGPRLLAAEALLRANRAAEAKQELELSLQRHPAHVATFFLLGRAAEKMGDLAAARAQFSRAAEAWRGADADFAPANEARAWLASHPATATR